MSYANGQTPESALVTYDGLHTAPSMVPRLIAFAAFAAANGHPFRLAHPLGSYRTLAEQRSLSGTGNAASDVHVATPGTSRHGDYDNGAADLVGPNGTNYNAADLAWWVAHAGQFGLTRQFPPTATSKGDPNHFIATGTFLGGNVTPLEDDMTDAQYAQLLQAAVPYELVSAVVPSLNLNGWVWIDKRDGSYVACPSQGYATLAAAHGLSTPSPTRSITDEGEWTYIVEQLIPALGDKAITAVTNAALSDADVAKIVAALPAEQPVALSPEQLAQIETAAKQGGAEAIANLSFVITPTK